MCRKRICSLFILIVLTTGDKGTVAETPPGTQRADAGQPSSRAKRLDEIRSPVTAPLRVVLREALRLTDPARPLLRWTDRLAFSPDGKMLAAARGNNRLPPCVVIWDVNCGKILYVLPHGEEPVLRPGEKQAEGVVAMSFLGAGDRLATVPSSSNAVRIWDLSRGTLARTLEVGVKSGWALQTMAAFPDGKRLVCSSKRAPPVVCEVDGKNRTVLEIEPVLRRRPNGWPYMYYCSGAYVTADGTRLFIEVPLFSFEPAVVLFDGATYRVLRAIPLPHLCSVMAFAPDGSSFVYRLDVGPRTGDYRLVLVETSSGAVLLEGHPFDEPPYCAAYTPDGRYLVIGGSHQHYEEEQFWMIGVWELATGRLAARVDRGRRSARTLAISPDNRYLAVPCGDIDIYRLEYAHDHQAKHRTEP